MRPDTAKGAFASRPGSASGIPGSLKRLRERISRLSFAPPVAYVYNPLCYAFEAFEAYLDRYGQPPKKAILLGMNPGPWGMAQTGVPFGEVSAVRDWLKLDCPVGKPAHEHPKREVLGLGCPRSEVSGARLWGWARQRFGTPEAFFSRFFVYNYCPLMFLEESGRNRTPDRLKSGEKAPLFRACDEALRDTVACLQPEVVIGVGRFAEARAQAALADQSIRIASILHPSPANPAANRGWSDSVEARLEELGLL